MNDEKKDHSASLGSDAHVPAETGAHPARIQRSRAKGWKMPANTVYVGRPGRFGNPFRPMWPGHAASHLEAQMWYRAWLAGDIEAPTGSRPHPNWIASLRGKNLACWCPLDKPCHADVLLEIANGNQASHGTSGSVPSEAKENAKAENRT